VPRKPAEKSAERALKMLGGGFLCWLGIRLTGSLLADGTLSVSAATGTTAILSLVAAVFTFYSLILAVRAFLPPSERGVLKYVTVTISGLMSLIFGLIVLANALDVLRFSRDFF